MNHEVKQCFGFVFGDGEMRFSCEHIKFKMPVTSSKRCSGGSWMDIGL